MDLPAPKLVQVCTLMVNLAPINAMGAGRAGDRRIIPIIGGTVTGPKLSGRILNLGADWQTVFASGVAELDTRYAMETDDGATIEIRNYGYRHGPKEVVDAIARGEQVDPSSFYMRTHARLETGDPRYEWVNKTLFVGTGTRMASSVQVDLYALR